MAAARESTAAASRSPPDPPRRSDARAAPDSTRDAFHGELFLADTLGGWERPLTANAWSSQVPGWSPDGEPDLYLLDRRTGDVTRLTRGLRVRSQPSWSPDDAQLLFSGSGSGVEEVYRVGRDGRGLVRLTRGTEGLLPPAGAGP